RIDNLSNEIIGTINKKLVNLQSSLSKHSPESIAYKSISEAIERTENIIRTIENNKGKYITRAYQAFSDSKYIERLTVSRNRMSEPNRRKIDNAVNYLVNVEGYSLAKAKSYIAEYLDEIKRSG